jgi:UDP-N-acetylglucosamine 1-carboxyvinyltransferase
VIKVNAIRIYGGNPLSGTVRIQGAKNAAQKILPATIVYPGVHSVRNISAILDAAALQEILEFLGARIQVINNEVRIDTTNISNRAVPPELTQLSTGTFLFAGALLARFGEAAVAHPGGDRIGPRPVDLHLRAFQSLGTVVEQDDNYYRLRATELLGGRIDFPGRTANGAVNAVMAAARASGTTHIRNVTATDPDIMNFFDFLRSMGVDISSTGPDEVRVIGRKEQLTDGTVAVIPDRNDAATFAVAAAMCRGPVQLLGITQEPLRPLSRALSGRRLMGRV